MKGQTDAWWEEQHWVYSDTQALVEQHAINQALLQLCGTLCLLKESK